MSVVSSLKDLNFHDSRLVSVGLSFPGGNDRTGLLDIDYYDWEGNAQRRADDANATWLTKRLRLSFGFLAHIELSAPHLVNRAQDIDQSGGRLSPLVLPSRIRSVQEGISAWVLPPIRGWLRGAVHPLYNPEL